MFIHSLAIVVDLLATADVEFDVVAFDELQRTQKLFVLYRAARGLLCPDEPMPELTAATESSVAVVYEQLTGLVVSEIEDPDVSRDSLFWRRLVLEAAREQGESAELPEESESNIEEWMVLIECLTDRVLWDNDYDIREGLDLPPEQSQKIRDKLGMADDYLTDIPDDPPDEQASLYIDALKGLTAQAR